MQTTTKRANVTVDDRRVALMASRFRKPADVAAVPHEQYIRQFLKARLGYSKKDPASQAIKDTAKQMAESIKVLAADAVAQFKARHAGAVVNTTTGEVKQDA